MKKLLTLFLVIVTLCGAFATSVVADTTSYYFNLGGGMTDMTKRTLKAGGSVYETKYYVRPTLFSREQNYKVEPHRIVSENSRPAVGKTQTIYYKNINKSSPYPYGTFCPANNYYYLLRLPIPEMGFAP